MPTSPGKPSSKRIQARHSPRRHGADEDARRTLTPLCNLRALRGREKKFKIRCFHARKLLKTLGRFCNFLFSLPTRVSVVKQDVIAAAGHCLNRSDDLV